MSVLASPPTASGSAAAPEASSGGDRPARWKALVGVLILPLFFLVALPAVYLGALHQPAPHDMRVAVIGSGTQVETLTSALTAQARDSFDVETVATVAEARAALRHLEIRAAYDPSTATVYVAGAGSAAAANTAEQLFTTVAAQSDRTLTVSDVVPLPASDRLGVSLIFLGLAAVVAGFLTATVLNVALPGLSIRRELGYLAGAAVAAAVIPMFTAYCVYGVFNGAILGTGAFLAAVAFVTGVFHAGGLRLIGPAMVMVTVFFTVILGVPASGAAVPQDMLPAFFDWLHPLLSTPAALDGLRRVLYFDGAGIGRDVVTLAMWALIGFGLLALSTLKAPKPDGAANPFAGVLDADSAPSDPAAAKLRQRRTTAGVLVMPLFFLIVLPLSFLGALHSPTPYHLKVAVIGTGTPVDSVIEAIEAQAGDALDVSRVDTAAEAQRKIADLDLRGAYDPMTGDLYVASAGGTQASATVTTVFTTVAEASGTAVTTHDVVSLPDTDPLGTSLLYVGIGAILAGFITAIVVSIGVPGLGTGGKIATVVVMSAVAAGVETLYGWALFDAFDGQAGPAALMLFGLALVSGLLTVGGMRVIGPAMVLVSILVLILLGVPASGLVVPLDLTSPFYGVVHNVLPTASGLDGLRRIVYFDGHGLGGDVLTMALWALGGLALLALGHWRHARKAPDPMHDPELLDDTAAAAAAAAAV
ncbi:hypothetical protein [Cryptosporangium aurantiacum]|uniref:ABC-2 family transporter protein n=1 Tax=Cryptosporangium aurantiacum TaxID=134849 RepID=A0A1M7PJV3_9ACTN|nr:hypothetical protein [Cryptosporangium aurantiacum]SHN17481.1 hypothetical protein SAMN05443668_103435 [Cryptosporangium aurantiacum]